MAIIVEGSDIGAGSSITIPTHAIGNLIIVCAYRDGSATRPSVPAAGGTVPTWTQIGDNAGTTNAMLVYAAIATATNHTTGTWTNASHIGVVVLSGMGTGVPGDPFFASNDGQNGGANSFSTAPGTEVADDSGNSLVLRFHGHRTVTAWSAAPAGFTRVDDFADGGGICINSTDDGVGNDAVNQATNLSSGWVGVTVEIPMAAASFSESPQFDAATIRHRTSTTDPETWTHTPVGTPRAVVVVVNGYNLSTDEVTAVSYGGVALTEAVQSADADGGEPANSQIWFLGSGIPTGPQTVSVDFASATTTDFQIAALTYTADGDCDVVGTNEINGDTATPAVTVTDDDSGRESAGVVGLVSGNPSASEVLAGNLELKSGQLHVNVKASDGTDTQWIARRSHPDASDWACGWTSGAGADDAALTAILLASTPDAPASTFRPQAVIL